MTKEAALLLFALLACSAFSNFRVNNIGNRSYSMYYESHGLVERKGILKLIYYKPKHFHRYSIWEVTFFFFSFFVLVVFGIMFGIGFFYPLIHTIGLIAVFCCFGLFLIAELIRISCIDIQCKKEDKYRASPKPDLDTLDLPNVKDKWVKSVIKKSIIYGGTIRGSLIVLYNSKIKKAKGNKIKIDSIDSEFIQYYRDYKKITVDKNKVIYKADEIKKDS